MFMIGGGLSCHFYLYGWTCLKGKSEVLSPDAIFGFGFFALLCFALDRLLPSPPSPHPDDLVKTKFTLIAGVSKAFPVWSIPAHLFYLCTLPGVISHCSAQENRVVVRSGGAVKSVAIRTTH